MQNKIKIAVVGYGNVGRNVVEILKDTEDMDLVGVVNQPDLSANPPQALQNIPLVMDIKDLPAVQVAIVTTPSRLAPTMVESILKQGINTVDSFDIHSELPEVRKKLTPIAQKHQAVSIISAGWDPGTDSMVRCMFEFMSPRGITYTNFGPGMSMGHSTAVKAMPGVQNSLSLTIPLGTGVHRRMVYVQLEPGTDFAQIENQIKQDPYFVHDETHVFAVADVEKLIDMGHAVLMERKGGSAGVYNQMLSFSMHIDNPALTAQILVSSARAVMKQAAGCYTMIEIPIIDFMYGDPDEIIRHMV